MEALLGAFDSLLDLWNDMWLSLESFPLIFASWLPFDIASVILILLGFMLVLALWRVLN